MRDWNCDLYLKFERERAQAARDLLSRIPPSAPQQNVDLGCGPGNSAAILSLYYRCGDIVGIDRSPSMIKAARERLPVARFDGKRAQLTASTGLRRTRATARQREVSEVGTSNVSEPESLRKTHLTGGVKS